MSEISKITEDRRIEREAVGRAESRQLLALEQIADALEGIRQDMSELPLSLAVQLQRILPK